MDVTPVHRTDEHGVTHIHPRFVSWHCSVHDRVCSPFTPVTATDLLRMAAKDETLGDDTFTTFTRTIEGE